MVTQQQKVGIARHSPLGLGQYYWPKRTTDTDEFYYRAHKTNKRVNRAIRRLHDPDDKTKMLVISQPPRTGKSLLASKFHPSWYVGKHPDRNVLVTGYSSDLCEEFGAFARGLISEIGENAFGVSINNNTRAKGNWKIAKRRGGMRAVSIMGQITGFGYNHTTIDDPYANYEDAHSPKIRRKVWAEIGTTVDTRMEEPATQMCVATRWHPDDASGRYKAMAEAGDDTILVIDMPAVAKEDMLDEEGKLFALKGELLYPWQWNHEKLETWKRKHGSYMYSALFDCSPTTPDGTYWEEALFIDCWFDKWPETRYMIHTIDPAAGAEVTKGCDSAIIASATSYGAQYFVDADLAPSGPVETVQRWEKMVDRLDADGARFPDALGIEHNATQVQSLLDKVLSVKRRRGIADSRWNDITICEIPLKRDMGEELGATRDKDVKIQTLDPYFRDKQYKFRSASPGSAVLVQQCKFYGIGGNQLVDGLDALEMNAEMYSQIYEGVLEVLTQETGQATVVPSRKLWV